MIDRLIDLRIALIECYIYLLIHSSIHLHRLTGWRTSWWESRRSSRPSPRSSSRPSPRCPDTNSSFLFSTLFHLLNHAVSCSGLHNNICTDISPWLGVLIYQTAYFYIYASTWKISRLVFSTIPLGIVFPASEISRNCQDCGNLLLIVLIYSYQRILCISRRIVYTRIKATWFNQKNVMLYRYFLPIYIYLYLLCYKVKLSMLITWMGSVSNQSRIHQLKQIKEFKS